MAIKIKFDPNHNAECPTMVLSLRNGTLLKTIPSTNLKIKDSMSSASLINFDVYKKDCQADLWENLSDFKLVWAKEWNKVFEIKVDVVDNGNMQKRVSATALGEAELSQINLYDFEVNTEDDINRDDYVPVVLYDKNNPNSSLLSKILKKVPAYKIGHVDLSIATIQRTFSFDQKDIYSSLLEIGEEIRCLFVIDCYFDKDGKLVREINVFDLESYCMDCGERGEFLNSCDKCGSGNIKPGYGEDTTIFVTTENLADEITYTTDVGSVKNCFKLFAGDDLMTATIANSNPGGSQYIWFFPDETKADMSDSLRLKLDEYDQQYSYYNNEYSLSFDKYDGAGIVEKYNALIDKYSAISDKYKKVTIPVVGYSNLMIHYYDVIDFFLFLNNTLMPQVTIPETTAQIELGKLEVLSSTPVAVQDLKSCTVNTATRSVLSVAKTLINTSKYSIKTNGESFSGNVWTGSFSIASYANENDTATSHDFSIVINEDYELFVKQKIDNTLNKNKPEVIDLTTLFHSEDNVFKDELKKYSLSWLEALYDSCQNCLDVLIEQGVSDKKSVLYDSFYLSYYNKLKYISDEIEIRKEEINVVNGSFDKDGFLVAHGLHTILDSEKTEIQNILNFKNFLGNDLWLELSAFRREDVYKNDNYISDGLDNTQLLNRALEFVKTAKDEIKKSATLQHSISTTLKDLLVIKEFSPIVDYFEVGNWIRVKVDDDIYKLRLLEYEINFSALQNISVEFSDISRFSNSADDVEKILEKTQTMSSSFDYVARQASQGSDSTRVIDNWVSHGMDLTNMKIVSSPDDQNITFDSHGLLCKEYVPALDSYDDKQLKIINKGLYLTDDNWLTSRAGIGNFYYYNPAREKYEESYGVIADTLVGNLILSKEIGVYTKNNSISMNDDGLTITTNIREKAKDLSARSKTVFLIQKQTLNENGEKYITPLLYVDDSGNLVLDGSILIGSSNHNYNTIDYLTDETRYDEKISEKINKNLTIVNGTIEDRFNASKAYADGILGEYKDDVSKYMTFDSVNGLILGAKGTPFKTQIDDEGVYFKQNDAIVSYITNLQLHIPNAVIENTLTLGNFFFAPREDGGVSLVWKD